MMSLLVIYFSLRAATTAGSTLQNNTQHWQRSKEWLGGGEE